MGDIGESTVTANRMASTVQPVVTLVHRCDQLAQRFDSIFLSACMRLTERASGDASATLDDTLTDLRTTLDKCEDVVSAMLRCIYDDIPHLLDMLDRQAETDQCVPGVFASWNPKQALDDISELFYVSATSSFTIIRSSILVLATSSSLILVLLTIFTLHTDPDASLHGVAHAQSYQDVLLSKRDLLAEFSCEQIARADFVQQWTSIDSTLTSQRKQQVDDLADLFAAF